MLQYCGGNIFRLIPDAEDNFDNKIGEVSLKVRER